MYAYTYIYIYIYSEDISVYIYIYIYIFYQIIQFTLYNYTNKQRAYNIEIKNIKRNYYTCTERYEPLQKS